VCTGWRRLIGCLKLQVIFAKEPLIIRLFCGKWPMKIRHRMTRRHPVSSLCICVCVYVNFCVHMDIRQVPPCKDREECVSHPCVHVCACVWIFVWMLTLGRYRLLRRGKNAWIIPVCCIVLQQCVAAVCCSSVLQQCVAVSCRHNAPSEEQEECVDHFCVAVCCFVFSSMLQQCVVAVCCSALQTQWSFEGAGERRESFLCCSVLLCVAKVRCSSVL